MSSPNSESDPFYSDTYVFVPAEPHTDDQEIDYANSLISGLENSSELDIFVSPGIVNAVYQMAETPDDCVEELAMLGIEASRKRMDTMGPPTVTIEMPKVPSKPTGKPPLLSKPLIGLDTLLKEYASEAPEKHRKVRRYLKGVGGAIAGLTTFVVYDEMSAGKYINPFEFICRIGYASLGLAMWNTADEYFPGEVHNN